MPVLRRCFRRLLVGLVSVLFLVLALGILLAASLLDQEPEVAPPAAASPREAALAKAAAKRALKAATANSGPQSLSFSTSELEALPSLVARAYPRLHSRFKLEAQRLDVSLSLRLPTTPLGSYLSLRVKLPQGPLKFQALSLGTWDFSDRLSARLVPAVMDLLIGESQRRVLTEGIDLVEIHPSHMRLLVNPPANPGQRLSQVLQRLQALAGEADPLPRDWIQGYYRLLLKEAGRLERQDWVSLTYFMAPLFREVARRSAEGQAHRQGQAALLALALYLGDPRLERLTGRVLSDPQRAAGTHYRTLLRGRIDLRQHFVVSAALQVLAREGISLALGEFKELLDTREGGSGFSFADLAADRAGVLFASRFTAGPERAEAFLDRFDSRLREAHLMVPLSPLPEGIDEADFNRRFGNLSSPEYRALVARIDQALESLELYAETGR